jgi:hypothetical protein
VEQALAGLGSLLDGPDRDPFIVDPSTRCALGR